MSAIPESEHVFEHEHDPEPGRELPAFAELWRGLVLLGVGVFAFFAALHFMVKHTLVSLPLWLALDAVAVLATWAGLIHVTGGEKFDDHPEI